MMQTQTLVQHAPHRPGNGRLPAMAYVTGRNAAKRACDVFLARTAAAGPASDEDRRAIIEAVLEVVSVGSNRVALVSARSSTDLRLIVGGWMYRAHVLANGARQITDILLPGDLVETASSDDVAHDIRASGSVQLAVLRRDIFACPGSSSLRRRREWMRDEQARVLRSRLVSLGRRDAFGRVAHLMAEIHDRLSQVGLASNGRFMCPLTQEQLADALGLTAVHVNRVLQRLRREGLVMFDRPHVVIPKVGPLRAAAQDGRS